MLGVLERVQTRRAKGSRQRPVDYHVQSSHLARRALTLCAATRCLASLLGMYCCHARARGGRGICAQPPLVGQIRLLAGCGHVSSVVVLTSSCGGFNRRSTAAQIRRDCPTDALDASSSTSLPLSRTKRGKMQRKGTCNAWLSVLSTGVNPCHEALRRCVIAASIASSRRQAPRVLPHRQRPVVAWASADPGVV